MIGGWLCRHRRFYICGYRVHHGRVGLLLTAVGVALMIDDLADWPWTMLHQRFGG